MDVVHTVRLPSARLQADLADGKKGKWVYLFDGDGEAAGAPQNVAQLVEAVETSEVPILFEGGIRTMHVAEMVAGLGVWRFAIRLKDFQSRLLAAAILSKFGEQAVLVVSSADVISGIEDLGARRLMLDLDDLPVGIRSILDLGTPAICRVRPSGNRNLDEIESVGFEAAILAERGPAVT